MEPTNIDFFEEQAIRLIGIELKLSREKKPSLLKGCTTGKAKIKRQCLKKQFSIDTDYKLACLIDALQEKGYTIISPNYCDDLLLINIRILKTGAEEITVKDAEIDFQNLKADVDEYEKERAKLDVRRREEQDAKN